MATPVLRNAENFDFTTTNGDRLDLFGRLNGWSDEIQTGLVEKRYVRRSGARHQDVGAPPRRMTAQCTLTGPDVRAQYERLCAAIRFAPEGRLTHPRFGSMRAVCEGISASENPGDAIDVINVTLKFSETGLSDPPKPAPTAEAATASTQAAAAAIAAAPSGGAIAVAGVALQNAAAGFLVAMQSAEAGLGSVLDVDASLAVVAQHAESLQSLAAPWAAQRAANLALASALRGRNRFQAGRPPLIWFELQEAASLQALCQRLYGGRGLAEKAQILRLNRVARPYSVPAGARLLLTDPKFTAVT